MYKAIFRKLKNKNLVNKEHLLKNELPENCLNILTLDTDFNTFCKKIISISKDILESNFISLFEVKNGNLILRGKSNKKNDLSFFCIKESKGISGYVSKTKSSIIISDIPENKENFKLIESITGIKIYNIVSFPIIIREKVFFVFECINCPLEDNLLKERINLISSNISKTLELKMMLNWKKAN